MLALTDTQDKVPLNNWQVTGPKRLDAFLTEVLPEVSRARLQRAIKAGCFTVDGKNILKPSLGLTGGESVSQISEIQVQVESTQIAPTDLNLEILYEDDACLVVNKPRGIAVHPGHAMDATEQTLLNGIAHLFNEQELKFSAAGVLVHRLDRETTGAILIAKDLKSHEALQGQFAKRTVKKRYLALVAGVPSPAQAKIDSPIGRHVSDRTKMSVLQTSKSRPAQTTYNTRVSTGVVTLLECELHTGRTHQIRVHLNSIGHSILGDDSYGTAHSKKLTDELGIDCLCLHAWELEFVSPEGKEVKIECPIPPDFKAVLDSLNL